MKLNLILITNSVACFFRHKYERINIKKSSIWLNKKTGERVNIWTDKCVRCGKQKPRTDIF